MLRAGILVVAGVLLMGHVIAGSTAGAAGAPDERWYGRARVERGGLVFAQHCAACHGQNAEGTNNWRQRTADGNFPPPPVNGTAHAWHHPFKVLASQIKFGTPGGQGSMPAFADKLSDEQIIDVIAWFQDKWPDGIYASWMEIELRSRSNN